MWTLRTPWWFEIEARMDTCRGARTSSDRQNLHGFAPPATRWFLEYMPAIQILGVAVSCMRLTGSRPKNYKSKQSLVFCNAQ